MPLLAFAVVGVLLSTVWMLAEQSLRRARHASPFRPIISDRAAVSDAPADAAATTLLFPSLRRRWVPTLVTPRLSLAHGASVDFGRAASARRLTQGMDASTAEDGGTRADADDSEPPG